MPLYYERNGYGYSENWVKKSKTSMRTLMPRFNAQRMVMDYVQKYYGPAKHQLQVLEGHDFSRARELAAWRKTVAQHWSGASLRRADDAPVEIRSGATLPLAVAAHLNGLDPSDVLVECLVGIESESGELVKPDAYVFTPVGRNDAGETLFRLDLRPRAPGLQYYKIRMFPFHPNLSHRYETGCMIWL